MRELLLKEFYGNTIEAWVISLGIILIGGIIGKIIYWIFKKQISPRINSGKTTFLQVVVDMVEEPISMGVVLFCMYLGFARLTVSPGVERWGGHLFTIAITLTITWLIARLWNSSVDFFIKPSVEKSESTLDDALLPIVKKGVRSVIWMVGIIVGLNNAGYDVAALIAGLGIGGIALAMAAKDSLSNIFGGITIFIDKPFKMGDRILVEGIDGYVHEIGIRTTRIKTLAGRIVTIPNHKFTGNIVENITLEPSRKIKLELGLTYDTSRERMDFAMELLRAIDAEHRQHLQEDSVVAFSAFGNFALGITYIYYIKSGEDIFGVQSKINSAILERFNREQLEFAFPSQTLYLKQDA